MRYCLRAPECVETPLLATDMCVLRTCYCDDTNNSGPVVTKGKKHAEKTALRRYLPDIKLKIMLTDYELLFSIFI